MHSAKGLEYKVVIVADTSDTMVPHAGELQGLEDAQDVEDVLIRERQLLYVALTRGRDEVIGLWVGQPSRFLPPTDGPGTET